jgi:ubiquitin-like modifier-activating enzyme ATG7
MSPMTVKFLPFSSTVESAFWVHYCHMKLETIQLKEDPISIRASVDSAAGGNGASNSSNRLQLRESSLKADDFPLLNDTVACHGTLIGYNTLEAFQKVDKNAILRDVFVQQFFDDSEPSSSSSSSGGPAPSVDALTSFVLLTFADLKQHKVLYWFGFPALLTKTPIVASRVTEGEAVDALDWASIAHGLQSHRMEYGGFPTFLVYSKMTRKWVALNPRCRQESNPGDRNESRDGDVDDFIYAFLDPSSSASDGDGDGAILPMGWPMRNLIAYLSVRLGLGGKEVKILSLRPGTLGLRRIAAEMESGHPPNDCGLAGQSILLSVKLPQAHDYEFTAEADGNGEEASAFGRQYKVVGWEPNARSKPGPRWVNLRPLLDQNHLAIQAADLNLKLMKWRMIPDLDVDMLQSTRVLLIGAGTLGCSVARTLLGWGVRKFKFVDYGTVSYSNPVRQNLFTLEDCHFNNGQGRGKAEAAASALKTIAADVDSEAILLSVPMPGHASETEESLKEAVQTLDCLVQEADAIFLLTDTRESRWLPTVMAAAHDKVLINAALGLDSWLVMRHGGGDNESRDTQSLRLGCYFCNDVVAPENSTKNRTLDQQCTVTRPGLAPIASSMAVEVLVSLLHHPHKQRAAAPTNANNFSPNVSTSDSADGGVSGPLGVIPHQIRGSLVTYTMMTPAVPAFKFCTACSKPVIDAYGEDKLDLVSNACSSLDGTYLEDLSGLAVFRAKAAEKMAEMEENWYDDDVDDK